MYVSSDCSLQVAAGKWLKINYLRLRRAASTTWRPTSFKSGKADGRDAMAENEQAGTRGIQGF